MTRVAFLKKKLFYLKERRSASQLSKKLIKISMNEIQLQAIIGEGEFGTVYKGTYNGVCPKKNLISTFTL